MAGVVGGRDVWTEPGDDPTARGETVLRAFRSSRHEKTTRSAMTRWLHPPEIDRAREPDRFDPVAEGSRLGLLPELSLAIWDRVRADATDSAGRWDGERAQRR